MRLYLSVGVLPFDDEGVIGVGGIAGELQFLSNDSDTLVHLHRYSRRDTHF